jgi:hypothetical protein
MRIAAVRDTLNSLPGSRVIKMPEAEIAKAVQLLDLNSHELLNASGWRSASRTRDDVR